MKTVNRTLCIFLLLTVLSGLAGCVARSGPDITKFGLSDAEIAADLGELPQDLTVYAERAGANTVLFAPDRQAAEDEKFNRRFFAAWDSGVGHLPKERVFEALNSMKPEKGFAENLRPYTDKVWQGLIANCFQEAYGNFAVRPAITVGTAHLRRMPTDLPYFVDPGQAGEGFPFDYMQNSVLWAGTPVAVIHVSRDLNWVYVQTHLVSGWTRATNLAVVDKAFISAWKSPPLGVIVQDNVELPVVTRKADAVTGGEISVLANVGTVLPLAARPSGVREPKSPHVFIHVPVRGTDGRAIMGTALAPMYATRKKPLPLTPGHVASVGNAMMGQPYGWGGFYGRRDCSAAMRDLFAPFGIWLPRNSRPQGQMGERRDLSGLAPDAKEEAIMQKGVPFFSLVSMPGHVGLYLGAYPKKTGKVEKDVPVMFHNVWGLRVVTGSGKNKREGRGVIGKAVVTTLRPGVEHPDISTPASLLDRVAGLAILQGLQ
ncbi:SH3 domain-containing protein [Desulfovibrio sp. OttesenSCG-928-O18]|nr:SH3 domain-containing protein [Desulfovibrio sp. OttesenSCG-928-O18]